ncbi:MAG: hypothetical protein RLZZ107_1600 [Bacteroidota bacterium]|jgi:hypothetical protein
MKKVFLSILGIGLLASCSKWSNSQKQINNTALDGTWIVSSYIDDGDDETNDFSTFRLDFLENGILNGTDLLSSNSNPYVGSWSITDSNSNDDSLDDLDFNMNFSVGNKLDDLSDDWDIISYTDTEIKLIDISGGGGGTDYLTLTKQ